MFGSMGGGGELVRFDSLHIIMEHSLKRQRLTYTRVLLGPTSVLQLFRTYLPWPLLHTQQKQSHSIEQISN